MDNLDHAMEGFGRLLGIDGLAFEDEECSLQVDGEAIDIVADRKRAALVLTALVGAVPGGERVDALAYLLELNCGPTLDGAALGLAGDAVVIVLHLGGDRLDGAEIQRGVVSFLAAVARARSLIDPGDDGDPPSDAASALDPTLSMIRA